MRIRLPQRLLQRRRRFRDRTVLVTGAAGGLGRALVERFSRAGARVGAVDVDADALRRAEESWRDPGRDDLATAVATAVADLRNEGAVRRAVAEIEDRLGPVHALVNNAGISHIEAFAADQAGAVRRVMEVNYLGAVHATAACFDSVVEQRGLFVAVSSVAGFAPLVGRTGYAASKHALHGFFDTLRLELRGTGAGVLLVAPSYVATGIRRHQEVDDDDAGVRDEAAPEMVADCIVRAAERGRRFLPIGRVARISWWLRRWCPRLYERLMLRSMEGPMGG